MSYQEIYRGLNKRASDEQIKKLASLIKKAEPFNLENPPPPPKQTRGRTGRRSTILKPVIKENASPIGSLLDEGKMLDFPWKTPAPLMDPIQPKGQFQAIKARLSQLFDGTGGSSTPVGATSAAGATAAPAANTIPKPRGRSGAIPKPRGRGATPKPLPRFDFRSRRAAKLFGKQPGLLKAMRKHPILATAGGLLTLGGIGAGGYALGSAGNSELRDALQRTQSYNDTLAAENKELKNRSILQVLLDKIEAFFKRWNGTSTENKQQPTTQGTK